MIKFFRHIRKSLLAENKTSKYLLYALGEIVLVVIGILIALQINNWREDSIRKSKENSYLNDIRANLLDDVEDIDEVVSFNNRKASIIDSVFYTLEREKDPREYMSEIVRYMFTLTQYTSFKPNRIAFDNMIGAENIDLITNTELKNLLSQYYKKEFGIVAQENVKIRAKELGDYVAFVGFNKQTINEIINYDSSLKDISEVTLHEDPKVYSYLFIMLMTTNSQSEILLSYKKEIEQIVFLLDQSIEHD